MDWDKPTGTGAGEASTDTGTSTSTSTGTGKPGTRIFAGMTGELLLHTRVIDSDRTISLVSVGGKGGEGDVDSGTGGKGGSATFTLSKDLNYEFINVACKAGCFPDLYTRAELILIVGVGGEGGHGNVNGGEGGVGGSFMVEDRPSGFSCMIA
jgi:hypothetical protein